MQILNRIVGFVLLFVGIYFLNNRMGLFQCWWQNTSTAESIILIASAIVALILSRRLRAIGWVLAIILIVFALTSRCLQMQAVPLLYFLLATAAMAIGFYMLITGRIGRKRDPVYRTPPRE